MDTLCTSQKQTHFTTSLLQDISILNNFDSINLEDWFTDIETAADLTYENRAKISKEKSKGLPCTLITEAFASGTPQHDIKALL